MAKQKSDNEGSGGKLLDTWYYEYRGIVEESREADEDIEEGEEQTKAPAPTVEGKKVAVELRLVKKFTDSDKPPLETKEVFFKIVCKEAGIHLSGNNLEELRTVMWGQLDKHFAVRWEEYYLVKIEPMAHWHFDSGKKGSGLLFTYVTVEKGTAWDGTLLMREMEWRSGYKITPWPGEFRDADEKVLACIPKTDFNEQALKEFGERIDSLRTKLADLLRPEEIMKTLADLSENRLLPPVTEPQKDEEAKDDYDGHDDE